MGGGTRVFTFLTLCLVITPYAYGMLEYYNMMFYGGACYAVKTLVPLLFLLLLQMIEKGGFTAKKSYCEPCIVALVYAFLLFSTVVSTGLYAVLCGILPIWMVMALEIYLNGGFSGEKKKWIARGIGCGGSILVILFGLAVHKRLYPGVSRMQMNLTKIENYEINFRACVEGIFRVFGATTSEDVKIMSAWGIVYLMKMGLVVLIIIVLIYNLVHILHKTPEMNVKKYLVFMFAFNFLVLLVADCRYSDNTYIEYRYYLIGAVPALILLGIQMAEWQPVQSAFQAKTMHLLIFCALFVVVAGNIGNVVKRWDRTTYAVELCDYFQTKDIDAVFFVDDPETSIICKGIDNDHKYGAYLSESGSLYFGFCSYLESQYAPFYGEKNIMAIIAGNQPEDVLPSEIAKKYIYIDSVLWFDLYMADHVYF